MKTHYPYILMNLKIQDADSLSFPYSDYGFLYGYGLFESLRIHQKKPTLLRQHLKRMEYASRILDIPFPFSIEETRAAVDAFIEKNNVENALLNIYLTPGDRQTGLDTVTFGEPFFLMVLRPLPEIDENKQIDLALREESFKRTKMDRFKTMTYMKNILEKRFAEPFDDVLLYSDDRLVLETSTSNLFCVKGELIFTPRSDCTLPGITRQYLINYQDSLGIVVEEADIMVDDLAEMDEVFICNSVKGIQLVGSLETVSGLSSGPVSLDVKGRYNKAMGFHV